MYFDTKLSYIVRAHSNWNVCLCALPSTRSGIGHRYVLPPTVDFYSKPSWRCCMLRLQISCIHSDDRHHVVDKFDSAACSPFHHIKLSILSLRRTSTDARSCSENNHPTNFNSLNFCSSLRCVFHGLCMTRAITANGGHTQHTFPQHRKRHGIRLDEDETHILRNMPTISNIYRQSDASQSESDTTLEIYAPNKFSLRFRIWQMYHRTVLRKHTHPWTDMDCLTVDNFVHTFRDFLSTFYRLFVCLLSRQIFMERGMQTTKRFNGQRHANVSIVGGM